MSEQTSILVSGQHNGDAASKKCFSVGAIRANDGVCQVCSDG